MARVMVHVAVRVMVRVMVRVRRTRVRVMARVMLRVIGFVMVRVRMVLWCMSCLCRGAHQISQSTPHWLFINVCVYVYSTSSHWRRGEWGRIRPIERA